ncbi:MAG: F0F1 ATP synthase subunit delta [Tannerella sp.]|jgi:F-type H+-transporting ATPase subunit delta|nr:F0F1 ATP synthase subunit delta [Tannerella sp.]
MDAGIISHRYAKAIFQFAAERKEEDRLRKELSFLSKQFISVPRLSKTLDDPTVSPDVKIKLLTTAAGQDISDTCDKAIRLIVKNKRTQYIQNIALMYDKVYREEKDLIIMKLVTTEPASDEVKGKLVDLVKKHSNQVEFVTTVDKDMIGGFIVEIDDMRLDASVRNILKQLRLELIHS